MSKIREMMSEHLELIREGKKSKKVNRKFKSGDEIKVRHKSGSIETFLFVSFVDDGDAIKMRRGKNGPVFIIDANSKKITDD